VLPPEPATVSVVLPTWNRRELVARALTSVLAQSRTPDEVIVVDDGSTDGTAEALREDFPGVVVLSQENRGVSAARNRGIAEAKGEWVAFLDSDDEWLPRKLETQLDALSASPGALLCHTDEIWIRRGRRVNPMAKHDKAGGLIFERCLALCAISPSSALLHRRLFDAVGLFDESLPACEDYDLWLRVTSRYPVVYVDEPLLVKTGGHSDQLSRRYWGMDRFRIRAIEKILEPGHLTENQRRAAEATLARKIGIYAKGARKRGREDEARRYESKLGSARAHVRT
jgi:glycosyltransferase involved in cell wall biosynthesis